MAGYRHFQLNKICPSSVDSLNDNLWSLRDDSEIKALYVLHVFMSDFAAACLLIRLTNGVTRVTKSSPNINT